MKPRTLNRLSVLLLTAMSVVWLPREVGAASKFRVLHHFTASNDGSGPILFAALAMDHKGSLYGATAGGGTNKNCDGAGCGVIFKMSRTGGKWSESVLYNFAGFQNADSPLTVDSRGNLYGCTQELGPMFELTQVHNMWTFDPIWPLGCTGAVGLISDAYGNVYGGFGNNSSGGVSELSPGSNGWIYTNLYEFCQQQGCMDGDDPLAPFTWDATGNLYGTTYFGGLTNYPDCGGHCGVAFQMTPNGDGTWAYHVMHHFDSFKGDGCVPYGSLTVDSSGTAYGTTTHCGPYKEGSVFKLTPTKQGHWKETVLWGFPGGDNGAAPGNNLVFDKSGNMYGIAGTGNCNGTCGLVFKLSPQKTGKWKYSVLHKFNGTDGDYPNGLTMDKQGHLYGTTTGGGKYGYGVVFEITP